jgi:hypothetical protein
MQSRRVKQAFAGAVLSSLLLLMMLLSGSVVADGPAPDRLVSYDYLAKYGRPAGIYALSESHDDDVCPELLSLLNERFKLTGPEALPDHVYLLHTRRDVGWHEVESPGNLLGGDWGFFVVTEQPASEHDRILLDRFSLGGYDVERLYFVNDKVLRAGSDQQGVLTLDFVRALEKDENGRHARVSADDWPGNPEAPPLNLRYRDYRTDVVLLDSGYYALITTPFAIDERGYVRQGLVVLAFRIDWQSLRQPICAFVH